MTMLHGRPRRRAFPRAARWIASDHIKKLLRDGEGARKPESIADELGDVIHFWSALCAAIGRKPSDVLTASRAKIEARITKRG